MRWQCYQRLILNQIIRISMSKVECVNCQRLHKQLNVQKADYEFEIKKIQQDKSTQKAMYEIHLQKQLRRWQQNFHKEQSLRQDEARNWLLKHDKTISEYENRIAKLTQDHENMLSSKITQLTTSSEKKYSEAVSKYENRIAASDKSHKEMMEKMTQSYAEQISNLKKKNQETIEKLKNTHKAQLDQKINMYEGKILGIESEKKKECELHKKTKQEAQESQTRLYQEIFSYKKNIIQLENRIENQKKEIIDNKGMIKSLEQKIVGINEENELTVSELKKKQAQELEQANQKYKNKIKGVYEDALKYCNQYQESITKIDQTRINEKKEYLTNLEEIQQSMENRMSRPEDLQQIQQLRLALAKKIKEFDMMNEELKWYRLELENKQETYNKIFVPINGSNNENIVGKRKEFKLRRQGRSVTTVREILQSINSGNLEKKNTPLIPKPKVL